MRERLVWLPAFLVAALVLPALASGRHTTTAPAAREDIAVVIRDHAIAVGHASSVTRGSWVILHVVNRSASPARISFLGKVSRRIAPRGRGSIAVFANRRGAYPLVASLSRDRRLSRTFIVY